MMIHQNNNNSMVYLERLVHLKLLLKKGNNFQIDGKICLKCMINYLDRSPAIMNHKTVKNQQANRFNLAFKDI